MPRALFVLFLLLLPALLVLLVVVPVAMTAAQGLLDARDALTVALTG